MSQATLPSEPYRNSNLFSGYYLDERVDDLDAWDCDDEAAEAFEELRELWDLEGDLVASYKEDELLDSWIDEVLDALGFGTLSETTLPGDSSGYNDRLLFESAERRRGAALKKQSGDAEAMYSPASAVLEAKQWDADFTERFDERRQYRDASHQIRYYLERTPEDLRWGVLTNGRKWRLYGTKDYATEIYYEVDLPELLESGSLEAFKYFYAFFRPDAFVETNGTSFLDRVWSESETAAKELGEDLQDNVFTALRVLGEGFVETNDLDIDPDDEESLAELKEQSLVLLYRLMFVLYAESRDLIHPDDPASVAEYEENFSLDQLRLDIHEDVQGGQDLDEYSEYSTSMWSRLQDLFRLVDSGEESLGIPPYNGGLFNREEHTFLAEHEVADRYIAEVIYRLGTTEDEDGAFVLADYADLDTRHLGSIYEGLLEHEFRIASEQYAAVREDGGQVWKPATEVSAADFVELVEAGELYVVNDEGERKATGAYYTPDYVVSYIVEETIDPLLEEIDEDLRADGLEPSDPAYFGRFYGRVQDLTILDPAMGSGHFLTKATGYLTERVMAVVREGEQGRDEQAIRRTIARECIYGVDVNGMAVELAKLSMWLETLAADQPLAFLDHHLKTGNSLVGSDITEVLAEDDEPSDGQLTLTQALAHVRQSTLEHVMELMQDLLAIDNETLSDIKSMEELYDEIRADPLYQRLFALANVDTAEQFGLDVPEGAYEEMARAIEDDDEWAEIQERDWFRSAQATAKEEDFFHWEIEYPEVFFGEDGVKLDGSGFDAVVGNPPYVRMEEFKSLKGYLESSYEVHAARTDLYTYFIEKSIELSRQNGKYGSIISNKFLRANYGKSVRSLLGRETTIQQIVDFGGLPVFPDATVRSAIVLTEQDAKSTDPGYYASIENLEFVSLSDEVEKMGHKVSSDGLSGETWRLVDQSVSNLMEKVEDQGKSLAEWIEDGQIGWGVKTGLNSAFIISEERKNDLVDKDPRTEELAKPLVRGKQLRRYHIQTGKEWLLYVHSDVDIDDYPAVKEHLEQYRSDLEQRAAIDSWYELQQPQEAYAEFIESDKILYPEIAPEARFVFDDQHRYPNNKCFFIPSSNRGLLAFLNSSLCLFYLSKIVAKLEGSTADSLYYEFRTQYMEQLPVVESFDADEHSLGELAQEATRLRERLHNLNLSLLDHLGSYTEGQTLSEVGLTQPPEGSADSVLQQTTEQKPNLRVGEVVVRRESDSTVEIKLTARYKPDDEDAHETDQWGYTETDPLPALRITDLTETEADLIEAFVPVAVDEAGGFADFRETATKTNSLVDRLRKLTLPRVADVEAGLESYVETTARAEELEEKIEQTDALIDEIVYELYGLSDDEIEIVEEAVGE
ncbi:Eco57I restriction-modification methylase domain-containing protein [Natronoarchaeum mannanilyticum]|uniref:site-specific DNA-methyltransferase (adenine-specific) n=1 Tax=Natronoarchaeum mannanilyticum TaxID=926360 RepID=A0AAV3T5G7_9EURY